MEDAEIEEQVRKQDRISRERWAGALMEVTSLFLIPRYKTTRNQRTDQ